MLIAAAARVIDIESRNMLGVDDNAPDWPGTGRNFLESVFCCAADSYAQCVSIH
jgi:hypothetical protein